MMAAIQSASMVVAYRLVLL